MRNSILIALLFFVPEFCFSQANFRKGYIITNARDTLFGLVDYRVGPNAYKSCDFKELNKQTTTTYNPSEIMGYGFANDKFFKSKEIQMANQLPKAVFLEVIVKGIVSLFKFGGTYWVEKDDQNLYQLINESKETYIDDKKVIKKTNQYIGTLNILLFDCAELRPGIQKIRLSEKPLTNLIERYNKCKGAPAIIYKAEKPWIKSIIGATAGVNISQIDFRTNNGGHKHLMGSFEASKPPILGFSIDFLSPRLNERISFHGDILYMKTKYHRYSQVSNRVFTERNYVTIELQQLKVPLGIRYTFSERKLTPYFNIGISYTTHLNSSSSWVQERESNNVVQTFNDKALTIKNNQFGLWGGIGILKSINDKLNFSFELRYEQTDGITPSSINWTDVKSKVTNFQIIFSLRTK